MTVQFQKKKTCAFDVPANVPFGARVRDVLLAQFKALAPSDRDLLRDNVGSLFHGDLACLSLVETIAAAVASSVRVPFQTKLFVSSAVCLRNAILAALPDNVSDDAMSRVVMWVRNDASIRKVIVEGSLSALDKELHDAGVPRSFRTAATPVKAQLESIRQLLSPLAPDGQLGGAFDSDLANVSIGALLTAVANAEALHKHSDPKFRGWPSRLPEARQPGHFVFTSTLLRLGPFFAKLRGAVRIAIRRGITLSAALHHADAANLDGSKWLVEDDIKFRLDAVSLVRKLMEESGHASDPSVVRKLALFDTSIGVRWGAGKAASSFITTDGLDIILGGDTLSGPFGRFVVADASDEQVDQLAAIKSLACALGCESRVWLGLVLRQELNRNMADTGTRLPILDVLDVYRRIIKVIEAGGGGRLF